MALLNSIHDEIKLVKSKMINNKGTKHQLNTVINNNNNNSMDEDTGEWLTVSATKSRKKVRVQKPCRNDDVDSVKGVMLKILCRNFDSYGPHHIVNVILN